MHLILVGLSVYGLAGCAFFLWFMETAEWVELSAGAGRLIEADRLRQELRILGVAEDHSDLLLICLLGLVVIAAWPINLIGILLEGGNDQDDQ